MQNNLRIAIAQLNFIVGDLEGNVKKHIDAAIYARDKLNADLILFPELSLTGYPPEDLLLRPAFLAACDEHLAGLMNAITNIHVIVGHPFRNKRGTFNGCSLFYNNKILCRYAKHELPNYGVFDEDRYFVKGDTPCVIKVNDLPLATVICEDLWLPQQVTNVTKLGAKIILSPNASPFETDKFERRLSMLKQRALENNVSIVYCNLVGGQDEVVFDGGSMVVNSSGNLVHLSPFFEESIQLIEIDGEHQTAIHYEYNNEEHIYNTIKLGLQDYVLKNQFSSVLIGVSGGIDSALTLAVAVDALGKDKVKAVYMPSRYSAALSLKEAELITANLGVSLDIIPIEPMHQSFSENLKNFTSQASLQDLTDQNIQSRCRAVILMALSNKTGALVLTTGNRSEIAVGYCTLYGDMAGAYSVLKDIPKTLVYKLANYCNRISAVIPEDTIKRPPTAELAPSQKDEDTLPPYPILDAILEYYINESNSIEEIVAKGYDKDLVNHVVNLIRRNEYKRKQSAIGPRINQKSFGRDWRYPLTNKFKG